MRLTPSSQADNLTMRRFDRETVDEGVRAEAEFEIVRFPGSTNKPALRRLECGHCGLVSGSLKPT